VEAALAVALVAAAAALAFAAASGSEDRGSPEQRAQAVAATLKCPVCHDLSAADSPAPVAQQMRARILGDLRAGRTPDQIRAEFVAAYGDWILLDPPRQGLGLVPWLAPALLGLSGLAVLVHAVRRLSGQPRDAQAGGVQAGEPAGASDLEDADRRLLERTLAGLRSEIE